MEPRTSRRMVRFTCTSRVLLQRYFDQDKRELVSTRVSTDSAPSRLRSYREVSSVCGGAQPVRTGGRMRRKRSARVSAAAAAAVVLAGCTASGDAEAVSTGDETPQSARASSSATENVYDGETCKGFSDVMTIVENADIGVREGRMDPQEQQGWYGPRRGRSTACHPAEAVPSAWRSLTFSRSLRQSRRVQERKRMASVPLSGTGASRPSGTRAGTRASS